MKKIWSIKIGVEISGLKADSPSNYIIERNRSNYSPTLLPDGLNGSTYSQPSIAFSVYLNQELIPGLEFQKSVVL